MARKGKKATETVQVRIRAWQHVFYDQTKEMPRAEYEELRDLVENAGSDADVADAVDGWIDVEDVCDAEPVEDVEVEEVK